MADRTVVEKTWYLLLGAVVPAERYADGGVQFFNEGRDGSRRFFADIRWLNEDGEVVTEDEARAEMARIKERGQSRQGDDPKPEAAPEPT